MISEPLKPDITKLIEINQHRKSTVLIFDCWEECVEGQSGLTVYEKARFEIDAFMNPKHPYYFQCLVQHYVLTQFYINERTSSTAGLRDLPTVCIASVIFRKRTKGETFVRVGESLYLDEEVPLILIVTPISFKPEFTSFAVRDVLNTWKSEIKKQTDLEIWACSAVKQFVTACSSKHKPS